MVMRVAGLPRAGRLAVPPTVLEVDVGQRIAVSWALTYQGPAYRETVYVAVYEGTYTAVLVAGRLAVDEKIWGSGAVDFPDSPTPRNIESTVPLVTGAVYAAMAGKTFGVYFKVGNWLPKKGEGAFDNVIKVRGVPSPTFTNLKITSYVPG